MRSFIDYFAGKQITDKTTLREWVEEFTSLNEAVNASRYSVEINFRSKIDEVKEAFAKICLGYVSAALKQDGYHIKQVFDDTPLRILVSTRNWDDGEWVGIISYNPHHERGSFVMSKGFYNKDRKTVSIQSSHATGDNAGDIVADLRNMMHQVRHTKDRHVEKLKPVPLKRGPKKK